MKPQNYKECHKVSFNDNQFLLNYDQNYIDETVTEEEEEKQYYLGYNYSSNPDWYYQYNKDDGYYYVVVDKED